MRSKDCVRVCVRALLLCPLCMCGLQAGQGRPAQALASCSALPTPWPPLPPPSLPTRSYNTIFLFLFACVAYGVGSCMTGQTARLPLVGDAADAQVR